MRIRIDNLEDFINLIEPLIRPLLEYADAPRSNYVPIARSTRDHIDCRNDYQLSAASPSARIYFARFIDRGWKDMAGTLPKPVHFVTFVSPRFAFVEQDARHFDLAAHQAEVAQHLVDLDFVAMTEVAYYPNWRIAPGGEHGPIYSWHTHGLTFGVSRTALEEQLAGAMSEESLIPNVPAVDISARSWMRAKGALLYSAKMPLKSYAPYPLKVPRERVDRVTGEVIPRTHGHKKDTLRTGELAKIVNLLDGHYLDDLLFGGGLGERFAECIKRQARGRSDAEERRWNERFGRPAR